MRPVQTALALASLVLAAAAALAIQDPEQQQPDQFDDLLTPAAHPDGVHLSLPGAEQLACAECHADVVAEWAKSRHGLAWDNPIYQEALGDVRRKEGCTGCHIPTPLHLDAEGLMVDKLPPRPEPRAEDHCFGVSCETCHLGPDGAMLGPWGLAHDNHPSIKHPHFTEEGQSALCIACHRTNVGPVIGIALDFITTRQAEKGLSCVECHMAPVERVLRAGPEELRKRQGRSHELQNPRDPSFLARAFFLEAARTGDVARLTIHNNCGHRIPGYKERAFDFEVTLLDADGSALGSAKRTLTTRKNLGVDRTIELDIELPAAAREGLDGLHLRVRAVHDLPQWEEPQLFLEADLKLE